LPVKSESFVENFRSIRDDFLGVKPAGVSGWIPSKIGIITIGRGFFQFLANDEFHSLGVLHMKCPFCHETDNRVIDSRLSKDSNMIRRRRECSDCNRRFTTYERVEEMMPLVVKKDGRRESYDRIKIINGLKRACEKRPVSINTIEAIADRIERNLQERGEKEIPSSAIGETLMRELHDTDQVAYVRFASVYRSFKDINEFMVELEELIKERKSVPATNSTRPRRE